MERRHSLTHLSREGDRAAWADYEELVRAPRVVAAASEHESARWHHPALAASTSTVPAAFSRYARPAATLPLPPPHTHPSSQRSTFPYELPTPEPWRKTPAGPPPVHLSPPRDLSQSSAAQKRRKRSMTAEEKRVARQCSVDGCHSYTIDRGLCFRHGGGKTCTREGCNRSAKARGLCWRHGGSVSCTVAGCERGAKSKGLCWSHGGGSKCSIVGCEKTIISKGLCWTHGGGKRCIFDGCKRPASESKHNFCNRHHAELQDGNTVYEV